MIEQIGSAEYFADQSLCAIANTVTEQCDQAPASESRGFVYPVRERMNPTPVDEMTGVSYPIISRRPLPPVGKSSNSKGVVVADWNHTNHPRERLIRGTPIEIALRNSRVEWVHRDDHNSYHKEFFGNHVGSEEQVLKQVIFNVAGYIPSKGLQYDGRKNAKIVHVNAQMRRKLWDSGQIKIAHGISIRDGLMDIALRKDFNGINESTIDEFLHTTDGRRRFVLGSNLLSLALSDLTTPLRPLYKEMHEQHQLRPDAPKTIGRFALKMVSHYRRTRALGILEGHLKAA